MNPYVPWLYGIPAVIAVLAVIPKRRLLRYGLLALATGVYSLILPRYVSWAYEHPFNPADGAAKVFAVMFGWAAGLLTLILPIYIAGLFIKTLIRFIAGSWPNEP